jgi:hypothetical protein
LLGTSLSCSKPRSVDGAESTAPSPAAESSIPGGTAALAVDGTVRVLRGTGIQIALPRGTERLGRELVFRVPGVSGKDATLIRLDRRMWSADEPAASAALRTSNLLAMANEFVAKGDPVALSEAPERAAIWGSMPANALGDVPERPGVLVSTRGAQASRVFLRGSFAESERSVVEGIAKSIDIVPDAELDPLAVHGVEMAPLPEGYSFGAGQLAPLWVIAPEKPQPFVGATFELRFLRPGQLQVGLDEALGSFQGNRSSCSDRDPSASGSTVKLTEAAATEAMTDVKSAEAAPAARSNGTVTCRFESPRSDGRVIHVRLDALEDAHGALIVVTLVPADELHHMAVFETLATSIRLKEPSAL